MPRKHPCPKMELCKTLFGGILKLKIVKRQYMVYIAPDECPVLLYDWRRVYRLLLFISVFRFVQK